MTELISWFSGQGLPFWGLVAAGVYLLLGGLKDAYPALEKFIPKKGENPGFDQVEYHLRELAKAGMAAGKQSLVDAVNQFQTEFRRVSDSKDST